MEKNVLIVGTGLAGITAALRLSKLGYRVEMVEKYHQAGGRLNQLRKDGFTWDIGPSFFSMSYEFDEFFKFCGIDPPFEFVELDPLYTVRFRGKEKKYTIYKDLDRLAEQFREVEPDFRKRMDKLLKSAGRFFHDTEDRVIKKNYNSLMHWLTTLATVPMVHLPKLIRTVWQELDRHFESEEVKQIFSLVAFFLGATPYDTPGVYTLLTYTELVHDGYHNVKGGMYKIVEGLMKEIDKAGITVHYHTEITGYKEENGNLRQLIDQNGNTWDADIFVINSDAAGFRHAVFERKKFTEQKLDRMKWTLAPFTMYLGVKGKIEGLEHHNYFLGDNFEDYANKIFKNSITLDKPYYYVNVNSRSNPDMAPEGHENLFVLCPVPDLRYKPDWSDREELAGNIIDDLSEQVGYDIRSNLVSNTIYDPVDWGKAFNLYKGSGLGLAHDLNQIGYFRPKNRDEEYRNVFYTGASTIPGTGLPMAVISSKLVTERITGTYGSL
ncbi:MAG: phytoene desaturase [Bacteroidales bacterium]|nr:phytoene desaturase [Bacteroidales bacterium]MBN2698802.1 phytoene desaturase [Bacteroidales bacterium]